MYEQLFESDEKPYHKSQIQSKALVRLLTLKTNMFVPSLAR